MDNKLSYEEWRKQFTVTAPASAPIDLVEDFEKLLKDDYQIYLCGGWDAIHEHNRMVSDMHCDPKVDPATIPPLWPILTNAK